MSTVESAVSELEKLAASLESKMVTLKDELAKAKAEHKRVTKAIEGLGGK